MDIFMMSSALLSIILVTVSLHMSQALDGGGRCRFPKEWRGRWYQSGLGEVAIRQRAIAEKGVCYETHRDYYLLYNRERACYQCLLMIKRHKNIIQYRESFCTREHLLKTVCNQIQVEATLYTLVREDHSTTKCPFQDAYYFNYNDNVAGFCEQPIGYLKPCVGGQQFMFHFKHCSSAATLNGLDLKFECVATWREGSSEYMYGQFSGERTVSKDPMYRCFKYEHYGAEIFMSMSADATCRGLNSPRDGPIIFALTKNTYGWLQPACQFPGWMAGVTWRDLSGRRTFALDSSGDTLVGYFRRRAQSKSYLSSELRCIQHIHTSGRKDEQQAVMVGFTTYDCSSQHQCIKLVQKTPSIVELYEGQTSDNIKADSCLNPNKYHSKRVLVAESYRPQPCPLHGIYIVDNHDGCYHNLDLGCQNSSLVDVTPGCPSTKELTLVCIGSWSDKRKTLFIASNSSSQEVFNCFSISERGQAYLLASDKDCDDEAPHLFEEPISYRIVGHPGVCSEGVRQVPKLANTIASSTIEYTSWKRRRRKTTPLLPEKNDVTMSMIPESKRPIHKQMDQNDVVPKNPVYRPGSANREDDRLLEKGSGSQSVTRWTLLEMDVAVQLQTSPASSSSSSADNNKLALGSSALAVKLDVFIYYLSIMTIVYWHV